ncbi:FtsX-like permease family protein [Candidatus Uhrbacteria bacterium]|nr:FtsX-like permease family protein [Candidatus Uhrbacteria bacterium]MBD3284325.1 FtsX-like permease family protein [Candidatus Uhrbacteria bacterium]
MQLATKSYRVFKAAVQNIFRNAWLGIATVIVLVMALTSVNLLVGVNALIQNAVVILEEKIDVTVFFTPDADEAQTVQAKFFIADLPQVRSAELMTKEETLANFRERHVNNPEILEALDELDGNPFGATLKIKARHSSEYPFIIEALKNPQFGDAIEKKTYDDHSEAINRVEQLGESSRAFGMALIAVFALIGILIVYNTIRVAIYTQREEIGIMRLVGASSLFVRAPFVVQGIILAVIALLISAGLLAVGVVWIEPSLVSLYDGGSPGLVDYFRKEWLTLLIIEGGSIGLLVGLTSWAAAGKYLRR